LSDEFRKGLLAQDENTIADIRRFFSEGARPLEQNEFVQFWQNLSDADKEEFKKADLS
jgi:hypothetical protein